MDGRNRRDGERAGGAEGEKNLKKLQVSFLTYWLSMALKLSD
jgi:hypothetical protein